jgi:hypothetical protein
LADRSQSGDDDESTTIRITPATGKNNRSTKEKPTGGSCTFKGEANLWKGVIRELFWLGLDTIGSCQEQAKGETFEGQAYVGFYSEPDARRFHGILSSAGIEATQRTKTLRFRAGDRLMDHQKTRSKCLQAT